MIPLNNHVTPRLKTKVPPLDDSFTWNFSDFRRQFAVCEKFGGENGCLGDKEAWKKKLLIGPSKYFPKWGSDEVISDLQCRLRDQCRLGVKAMEGTGVLWQNSRGSGESRKKIATPKGCFVSVIIIIIIVKVDFHFQGDIRFRNSFQVPLITWWDVLRWWT